LSLSVKFNTHQPFFIHFW